MGVRGRTLLEAVDFWVEKHPSKMAMTFLDDAGSEVDRLTYKNLRERIDSLAAYLIQDLTLVKGSVCILVYPPSLDFTVSFLACLRAGVIPVPCFPPDPKRLKKDLNMFAAIQGSSGATVALTSRTYNYVKKVEDIKSMFGSGTKWPELNWVVTDSLPTTQPPGDLFVAPDLGDVAFLQYTSGSTSEPKGVMITQSNLADNLKLIVTGLSATDDTVVVSWLPQYHDMGLIGSVLALLYCGGSGYYMSPATYVKRPALWVELISRYRGTHMQAPNFAYGLTARKFLALDNPPQLDLSCIRHMINAAEPVDAVTIDRFYAVFEAFGLKRGVIFPTYGLAEHTVYVCSNGQDRLIVDRIMLETERKVKLVDNKLELWAYGGGTVGGKDDGVLTSSMIGCGRPADSEGVDLRIVDTETEKAMPEGNVGEIWIRSKSRALGFWAQPGKTAEDFEARLADNSQAPAAEGISGSGAGLKGFLRTGDLGFLWKGELYICGRIKDLVIVRGRNHFPQDIEKTAESTGALRGGCSAAFGVTAACGEVLALVAEVADSSSVNVETLAADIRRCVAAAHGVALTTLRLIRPRTVPKTTSGKIARLLCKRAHSGGALDKDTLFLWGNSATSTADQDALAEEAETTPESLVSGSTRNIGVEESKGEQQNIKDMTEEQVLEGCQVQVARILKADPSSIPTDAPLATLGLDSMEAMQLLALLEERFNVKLPEDIMLEEGTTLSSVAPIVKAGGIVPERSTAIDCGKLASEEATDGLPMGYMENDAVVAKRTRRLAECSIKTRVETGKFDAGSLSKKAKMSSLDSLLARSFLLVVGGAELLTPVLLVICLAFAPICVTASVFVTLFTLSAAIKIGLHRVNPVGRYSRIRACVLKHMGLRLVLEGKHDPDKTYVYVGCDLGVTEQLLIASVAPSALGRVARPTAHIPWPFPLSLFLGALHSLLGPHMVKKGVPPPLAPGQSACVQASSTKALGMATGVSLAIMSGAHVVPCAVYGSWAGVADFGGSRFGVAIAAVAAALGLGDRGGKDSGVTVICAKPVRVPSTSTISTALVMEYAEAARAAEVQARESYTEAFYG